jgi:hypothetical protein
MSYHQPKSENRVFRNPLLEKLTHTHIAWPLSIFYGTALILLGYTLYEGFLGAGASILLFFTGLLGLYVSRIPGSPLYISHGSGFTEERKIAICITWCTS